MAECSVPGCKNPVPPGLCVEHALIWRRCGDPQAHPRGRPWTDAELRRLELLLEATGGGSADPFDIVELALSMERTPSAVSTRLHRLRRERARAG